MSQSVIWNFYATDDDLKDVLDWMTALPGMQCLEIYSRPDKANRFFDSAPKSDWQNLSLGFWPSEVGSAPRRRRIWFSLDTMVRMKAFGRTQLESPAIITIGQVKELAEPDIAPCELRYWTETSARRYGLGYGNFTQAQLDDVDWVEMGKTMLTVRKHIKASAVANWRSKPVLPGVAEVLKSSSAKLWFWGDVGTI